MASITEPPVIPNLSLPVPSRLNPEPFSMLMDRTLSEIPVTVDGINMTVTWVYDTAQVVYGWAQSASEDAQFAKEEAIKAESFAQMSAASATASEQARADITQLLDTITGELGLPENGTVGAPVIKTAEGLAIDQYPLGDQARSNETPVVEVSADYQILPYQKVGIDTRNGSFELTLPVNPDVGVWVSIYDINDRLEDWNSVTLKGNGQKIMELEEDLSVNLRNCRFTLEFLGENRGWVITK